MIPIFKYIRDAKEMFKAHYDFPAERLHGSAAFNKALLRALRQQKMIPANKQEQVVVEGLAVHAMTKTSGLFEFHLSATRNRQHFTAQIILEPEELGVNTVTVPGMVRMGGFDSSEDELEYEILSPSSPDEQEKMDDSGLIILENMQ